MKLLFAIAVVFGFLGLIIAAIFRKPTKHERHQSGSFHPNDVFAPQKPDCSRGFPTHPSDIDKPCGCGSETKDSGPPVM